MKTHSSIHFRPVAVQPRSAAIVSPSRQRHFLALSRWLFAVAALLLIASQSQAQLRPGNRLPQFDFDLLDGSRLPASELRGKVLVHMFWATWCPICLDDLPNLQRLHAAYASRGFEVIALSVDRNRADVEKFWRRHAYRFPVAMRTMEMRDEYGDLTGTPTFLITDRHGIVRVRQTGAFAAGELERRILSLL